MEHSSGCRYGVREDWPSEETQQRSTEPVGLRGFRAGPRKPERGYCCIQFPNEPMCRISCQYVLRSCCVTPDDTNRVAFWRGNAPLVAQVADDVQAAAEFTEVLLADLRVPEVGGLQNLAQYGF